MNFLLERKADVCARDKKGNSVLHKAESWETHILLRSHCGDFWHKDTLQENHDWQTPLHLAAMRGNFSMVEDMCRMGANPEQKDDSGHTPLHFAREGSHEEIIQCLEYYVDRHSRDPEAYYFQREKPRGR